VRRLSLLALASLFGGIALLGYGAATGQARVILIFPVFEGVVPVVGGLLIMLAMFLWFLSAARTGVSWPTDSGEAVPTSPPAPVAPAPAAKAGGVVFLGPFPIVFGSDPRIAKAMLILGIILAVILLAVFLLMYSVQP